MTIEFRRGNTVGCRFSDAEWRAILAVAAEEGFLSSQPLAWEIGWERSCPSEWETDSKLIVPAATTTQLADALERALSRFPDLDSLVENQPDLNDRTQWLEVDACPVELRGQWAGTEFRSGKYSFNPGKVLYTIFDWLSGESKSRLRRLIQFCRWGSLTLVHREDSQVRREQEILKHEGACTPFNDKATAMRVLKGSMKAEWRNGQPEWMWWKEQDDADVLAQSRFYRKFDKELHDNHMKFLRRLTQITSVDVSDTGITNAGLAHLADLVTIQTLDLSSTKIDSQGIRYLAGLTNLQELGLSDVRLSDNGLARLSGLVSLSQLGLGHTHITDSDLCHLKPLVNLRDLWLNDNRITDNGLIHLAGLSNLTNLRLMDTEISDNGLIHLSGLSNLNLLDLSGTKVTRKGLWHLTGLTQLIQLRVANTGVNNYGAGKLRRLMPGCRICLK